ncbi:peptidase M48 [Ectothiorhodospira shaposhnikovii]|uniref:zinc metalloprotease HtpX n=1 Tax=Ectothiorhodospira shaposhnikovii TaxID=1054 RepID=UPI0019090415|nr:zinc metalloprotease HtpX [Ectothiorhodospira shaposhnikovii]MBK1671970.1 peptidase M48 [Ectothiorhodospira shaposhnikovii]
MPHTAHHLHNRLQSLALVGAMVLLLGTIAWLIGGPVHSTGVVTAVVVLYFLNPMASPGLVMRMYQGYRLDPRYAPVLLEIMDQLADRAGLPRAPTLHYVPTQMMNAFAVGDHRQAAVAVSDGLLRRLSLRELTAVLAHEISHVAHNDLRTMTFADLSSRLTVLLSLFGQVLLIINLPLLIMGHATIHWGAILLLIFAPSLTTLFQLALSRSREYEADLGAARLTGDPVGLAMALDKLERVQGGLLEQVLLPGRRAPEPSWLRTHPATRDRIDRLRQLDQTLPHGPLPLPAVAYDPRPILEQIPARPRWLIGRSWF